MILAGEWERRWRILAGETTIMAPMSLPGANWWGMEVDALKKKKKKRKKKVK